MENIGWQSIINGSLAISLIFLFAKYALPAWWKKDEKQDARAEAREKRYQEQLDISRAEDRALLKEVTAHIALSNAKELSRDKKDDMMVELLGGVKNAFEAFTVKSHERQRYQEQLDIINKERFEHISRSLQELNQAQQIRESAERVKKKSIDKRKEVFV